MTLDQVTTAQELIALIGNRTVFHSTTQKDSKGKPSNWRLNGAIKTFKRDNTRILISLKYGMGYSRNDYDRVESVADFKRNYTIPE